MSHDEFEDKDRVETVRIRGLDGSVNIAGNFYSQVGGKETFRKLVAKFYEGVATDEVLRPMYPEEDLGPAAERLQLFLEQFWGGPQTYSEMRGHPRLKMRHMPLVVRIRAKKSGVAGTAISLCLASTPLKLSRPLKVEWL